MELNAIYYVTSSVYLLISVATAAVNIPLMIFLVRNERSREDIVSMVMLSQIFSDLGHGTVVTFFRSFPWPFLSNGIVTFTSCAVKLCFDVAAWHIATMAALKCYIIVKPMTYSTVLTPRLRNVIIFTIWAIPITLMSGNLAGGLRFMKDDTKGDYFSAPTGNLKAFLSLHYSELITELPPIVIVLFSYTKILLVVRKHQLTVGNVVATGIAAPSTDPPLHHHHQGGWAASVKSAKSLLLITVAYYVGFIPSVLIVQIPGVSVPLWYIFFSSTLLFLTPLTNASFYILFYGKTTRRDFHRMFCRWFGNEHAAGVDSTKSTSVK